MQKGKIIFNGSFGEYFLMSLGLIVLCGITFGLMVPYYIYWQIKYFASHLEIEMYGPAVMQTNPAVPVASVVADMKSI